MADWERAQNTERWKEVLYEITILNYQTAHKVKCQNVARSPIDSYHSCAVRNVNEIVHANGRLTDREIVEDLYFSCIMSFKPIQTHQSIFEYIMLSPSSC